MTFSDSFSNDSSPSYSSVITTYMDSLKSQLESVQIISSDHRTIEDESGNLLQYYKLFHKKKLNEIYHTIGFLTVAFSNLYKGLIDKSLEEEISSFLKICKILRGDNFVLQTQGLIVSGKPLRNIVVNWNIVPNCPTINDLVGTWEDAFTIPKDSGNPKIDKSISKKLETYINEIERAADELEKMIEGIEVGFLCLLNDHKAAIHSSVANGIMIFNTLYKESGVYSEAEHTYYERFISAVFRLVSVKFGPSYIEEIIYVVKSSISYMARPVMEVYNLNAFKIENLLMEDLNL